MTELDAYHGGNVAAHCGMVTPLTTLQGDALVAWGMGMEAYALGEAHGADAANNEACRAAIAAEYIELIGYDPFADDPGAHFADVAMRLAEWHVAGEAA